MSIEMLLILIVVVGGAFYLVYAYAPMPPMMRNVLAVIATVIVLVLGIKVIFALATTDVVQGSITR